MANSTKVKGCKIDFTTHTAVINYKFAEAAEEYGSSEYRLLQSIKQDFPDIKICVKSGREQKTARYNKRFTYANMEKYIRCFDNSDVLLKRFETVKDMSLTFALFSSLILASPTTKLSSAARRLADSLACLI